MTAPKRYPNAIDPILGYAPGTILTDDLADFRSVHVAEDVLLHRYRKEGFDGVKNVMMLSDNCALPEWFHGPEYQERYVANKLSEERLDGLAKAHMGGDDRFGVMAFNRTTAAERRKDKGVLATERPLSDAVRERPPPGDRRALRRRPGPWTPCPGTARITGRSSQKLGAPLAVAVSLRRTQWG